MATTVFVLCGIDPASRNIGGSLMAKGGFAREAAAGDKELFRSGSTYIVSIGSIHIYRENLDSEIRSDFGLAPDRIVFMSTHRSVSNTPAITFHPIGNYGDAELGGRPGSLVASCPELMTGSMLAMGEGDHHGYQVTYEATHHGPYLQTPAMFAEIGSDEKAWNDREAGSSVAGTLLAMKESPGINAIGIGGGHYCARFREIAQKRRINFGHFIPNHNLHLIDGRGARELIGKSPRTEYFAVHEDRKHAKQIERVASLMEDAGLRRLDHAAAAVR